MNNKYSKSISPPAFRTWAIALMLAMAAACTAQTRSVVSGGATATASATHRVQATLGQTAAGYAASGHSANQGFWTPALHAASANSVAPVAAPGSVTLAPCSPNPFTLSPTLQFTVSRQARVTLTMRTITGAIVQTLANEAYSPGIYSVRCPVEDLPTGAYIGVLVSEGTVLTTSMMLVR